MTDTDDPRGEPPEATAAQDLASALLDGEADATEAAGADAAAVVEARAAFERVARAVAAPAPVDAGPREAAIAAALGAADVPTSTATPVDELAPRRRAGRGLRLAGIAAALLAVVAVGGLVASGSSSDDDAAETQALDDSSDDAVGDGTEGAASGDVLESTATPALSDLGAFDDLASLVVAADSSPSRATEAGDAAAESQSPTTAAEERDESGSAAGAAVCTAPAPPPGPVTSENTATLQGRPVVVVVADGPDGRIVQVYDFTTCAVLFDGPP